MLHYQRSGHKQQALVLQHGFLGGGGYFAPQMAALGHIYDIIAPDLPGFAGSHTQDAVSSVEALSAAHIKLLDELSIDKFYLLGHSMGGMVALQTALDHPDRVQKLILYATNSTGNLPGRFETFSETTTRLKTQGVEAVAKKITASWFIDYERAPMFQFCLHAGENATHAAVEGALKAFERWDVTKRLHELKMPVLVIAGDKDRSYARDGLVQLANAIDTAELCFLPGAAHCVHLEQTEVFNSIIGRFLSRH